MGSGIINHIIIPVLCGFVLDLLAGDPHWLYHPVRLVGRLIGTAEKALCALFPKSGKGELTAGIVLVLVVSFVTTAAVWGLCLLTDRIHPVCGVIARTVLCYFLLAVRSLRDESMKVYTQLKAEDLPAARKAVSMIVGRDTDQLTQEGVTKAAVETVAENISDGIIAPMLYMLIGGPVLGWLYKSINTMDSMVGYKNDQYLYFGRAAARTDDVVNYIPARISALLMLLCCPAAGLDIKQGWRIFRRDRYNHASPNSAQTEAVMAGALHVQLAGDAYYFGKLYHKKTIGDDLRPIGPEDIRKANRLLYFSSIAGLIIFTGIRMLIYYGIRR